MSLTCDREYHRILASHGYARCQECGHKIDPWRWAERAIWLMLGFLLAGLAGHHLFKLF